MRSRRKSERAVVLLSGGLDSSTVLYLAKSRGFSVECIVFSYGQKHSREIESALKIAKRAGVKSHVVNIKFPWGGSSLTDKGKKIPSGMIARKGVPSTFVPGRNTVFISYALSLAQAKKFSRIFIGANAIDYSGYPDCRPLYFKEFNRLLKQACPQRSRPGRLALLDRRARLRGGRASLGAVKIDTPLIKMSKKEIVLLAVKLKVPLELTWSCYRGGSRPCGRCDSCLLRAKGFREAGIADPALAVTRKR